MSFITSIGTSNPAHKFTQKEIANFMIKAMSLTEEEARELQVLFRASGISSRYSVMSDYGSSGQFNFYPNSENLEPFPGTKKRLTFFRDESVKLSRQAVADCFKTHPNLDLKNISHLIVVSCTGMFAPGLDIELVHALGLPSTVKRTSINFMGCYAAFNALRVADAFCRQQADAKVLVVCTELCSLHFQREKNEDNLLANALFADGSAAVLMESLPNGTPSLAIGDFFCDLAPDGHNDMAWSIGDQGFEMKLSSYVPQAIKTGIRKLTQSLLSINHLTLSEVSFFAIHPGGKKILEAIEDELGITKNDNRFSYSVLKEYGNMSSPTVLFVLQRILQSVSSSDHGKKILSFGFGPGLTLESVILTVENPS